MRKIKITFIHYELVFGGAEQALFDLVNLLDKESYRIRKITSSNRTLFTGN